MSLQWLRNLAGAKLTDAEFKDIPNPKFELIMHVTIKDIQAFGMLGTLLVGPFFACRHASTKNFANIVRMSSKFGAIGAAAGVVIGPIMAFCKMQSLEEPAIVDRCYRLRRNRCQVRIDRGSIVGAAAGCALGAANVAGMSTPFGALIGMSTGLLSMFAYNLTAE